MGSSPHLWSCACKTATLAYELLVSIGPSPHLWFLCAKQWLVDQHTSLYGYQTSPVVLCMLNIVITSRMTSFYGFQPSSVVFFIQNSDLMTKIACLYGYKTSPVIFCMQNSEPSIRITSLYVFHPPCAVYGCKTATLGPDLQVCMGPSPHLWLLYAKQRLVDQHTSLYGYHTSPVVLCIQTNMISTRITSFYGFQPSSVVLYMKTATSGPDLQVCMGPRPHLWFWALITACLAQE